jgi:hypothetical protein
MWSFWLRLPHMNGPAEVFQGGCHCGAVRFQVQVNQFKVQDCNCSICQKKGFLHLIVPAQDFQLLQGDVDLSTYTFNTGIAKHLFCQICGIHAFYRPRSHPDGIDINLRCLDAPLEKLLAQFEVEPFDGRHWEENVHQIT